MLKERVRDRLARDLGAHLIADEELRTVAIAALRTRRGWLWGLINPMLVAFLARARYVAVTSRRLLVVRPNLTGRGGTVLAAPPLEAVHVSSFKQGPTRTALTVSIADGEEIAVEFQRMWREEADRIRQALEAV